MIKGILIIAIFLFFALNTYAKNELNTVPKEVNFGEVLKDSPKIDFFLKVINRGKRNVIIRDYKILNNPQNAFSVLSNMPFIVPFQSGRVLQVLLDPSVNVQGKIRADLVLYPVEMMDDSLMLPIFADVIKPQEPYGQVSISIPDLKVKIGENFNLPVIVNRVDFPQPEQPDRISLSLSFNASLITPIQDFSEDFTESGIRTIRLESEIEQRLKPGDTLAVLPFISALGDVVSTDVKISNPLWLKIGNPLKINTNTISGSVSLTDIYYDNGLPRLVSNDLENLYIYPPVNPISKDFILKIRYKGSPVLAFYGINGELIADYSEIISPSENLNEVEISISKEVFATKGVYIVRLSNSSFFVSQMLIVE